MAKLTFAEQIKHPNWQKRRLQIMERSKFSCERCGTDEVTLNVHHKRYVKGRMYWDYEDNELQCLCEDCHKQEHAHRELLERIVLQASEQMPAVEIAVGLLAGYFAGCVCLDPDIANEAADVDGHSYHLGVLASIAGGAPWPSMRKAADAVRGKTLSPAEEQAYELWGREAN